MTAEYKKIVLLKGLESINDYQFNTIKSLLARDLQLTKKMQDEYDRIKIADLMEEKFRGAASVDKLIELFKDMPQLKDLAKSLRSEKSKVARKIKAKEATPAKKSRQEEADSATPVPTTSKALTPVGVEETPGGQKRKNVTKEKSGIKKKKVSEKQMQSPCLSGASTSAIMGHLPPFPTLSSTPPSMGYPLPPKISSYTPSSMSLPENQRPQAQHQVATKKNALPNSPIVVRVLKATEAFEFESSEESKDMMFHATVVTENTFFQVKVFNINLKEKFTPKRVIVIKGYSESKGILEIKEASSVSEAGPDQKIEVPIRIIKRANETPKIDNLQKQASGTFVYGLFMLHKKTVNKKSTIYEIQDNTGKMDVVGKRKWHNIMCEEGDKLRLFCFQLRMIDYKLKLISGTHSFIKVIKTQKNKKEPVNINLNLEVENTNNKITNICPSKKTNSSQEERYHGHTLTTTTPSSEWQTHVLLIDLATPIRSSSCKERGDITTETNDSKRMKLTLEQSQVPQTSAPSTSPTEGHPQSCVMPSLTPSSNSLTKKAISKTEPKEASKEEGTQRGPKKVMVLKATNPYGYQGEGRKMFHATVATESEFFRVKVFDISLKEKFTPKRIITISNYVGRNGFLEVYSVSNVSVVNTDEKMEIPRALIKNANATPKISHICLQSPGTFVSGTFMVHNKMVRGQCTYYEIQDKTGKMEVIMYGRLTQNNCQEGDKLQLICFELSKNMEQWQLRSVAHSFIKVIKTKKYTEQPLNPNSNMET
ncbi:myeloid cell nuclear differentiation antigen-like isoform X2 [Elephas maximus indicus]|uniref:myeloid cell nuclear differentiation antigen-like isoform X2 n=1 Tax=Elephas maximus indicus TaxID=99487 RepID=UPI002116C4D2|nr:myeloid cell nuclear differentiation antigen-like isoform X2 [Elephas maximus indicus]